MTRTLPNCFLLYGFQLRVVCKKAQMETSQTAHGHPKTAIDNTHKHTFIVTLAVKKGSKFTDPDAQFPRGGALACARGCSVFGFSSKVTMLV